MYLPVPKPNEKRARNAIILIWIVMAADVAGAVSSALQALLLYKFTAGIEVADDAADMNDLREQVIGIIYTIVFLASAVTFILWFRRAYANLHRYTGFLAYPEGWAAYSWFVPILNLFRPFKIMRELYVETWALVKKKARFENTTFSIQMLSIWWGLWIVSNVLGQISFRLGRLAETLEQFTNLTYVSLANHILGIPLAIITVRVIKTYHEMEVVLPTLDQEADSDLVLNDLL